MNQYKEEVMEKLVESVTQVQSQVVSTETSNQYFQEVQMTTTGLRERLEQFSDVVTSIDKSSVSINLSTNEFATIIEESNAASEELTATLQELAADQEQILSYIEETYKETQSI